MSTVNHDGIYKSCSKTSPQTYPESRNVYIRGNRVQLVSDDCQYVFNFAFFFEVNNLGERIGDIPEDFKFGEHEPTHFSVIASAPAYPPARPVIAGVSDGIYPARK